MKDFLIGLGTLALGLFLLINIFGVFEGLLRSNEGFTGCSKATVRVSHIAAPGRMLGCYLLEKVGDE